MPRPKYCKGVCKEALKTKPGVVAFGWGVISEDNGLCTKFSDTAGDNTYVPLFDTVRVES